MDAQAHDSPGTLHVEFRPPAEGISYVYMPGQHLAIRASSCFADHLILESGIAEARSQFSASSFVPFACSFQWFLVPTLAIAPAIFLYRLGRWPSSSTPNCPRRILTVILIQAVEMHKQRTENRRPLLGAAPESHPSPNATAIHSQQLRTSLQIHYLPISPPASRPFPP